MSAHRKKKDLLLLETIRCCDGVLEGLPYHNERLNRARRHFWPGSEEWDLGRLITAPVSAGEGVYKVRVVYGRHLREVTFEPYRIRPVESLRLVAAGSLDYRWKYADRSGLAELFARRGDCDDILLVRDGYLTDSSYANVALRRGSIWYTPARPLLAGTRRARLLTAGRLQLAEVRVSELHRYEELRLFNAMFGLEDQVVVGLVV